MKDFSVSHLVRWGLAPPSGGFMGRPVAPWITFKRWTCSLYMYIVQSTQFRHTHADTHVFHGPACGPVYHIQEVNMYSVHCSSTPTSQSKEKSLCNMINATKCTQVTQQTNATNKHGAAFAPWITFKRRTCTAGTVYTFVLCICIHMCEKIYSKVFHTQNLIHSLCNVQRYCYDKYIRASMPTL